MWRHRPEQAGLWLVGFLLVIPKALSIVTTDSAAGYLINDGADSGRHGRSLLAGPAGSGVQLANDTVYDCAVMSSVKGPFNITTDLVLFNTTFRNCAPGGALSIFPAATNTIIYVTLQSCYFINNTASSSSSAVVSTGGAVTISGRAAVRLLDCTFNNNTAGAGGAVYSTAGGGAGGDGGWLELSGCAFRGNRGQGAALAVSGGVLAAVSGCNFTFNSGGSAVHLAQLAQLSGSNATQINIAQAYFSDNSADGDTAATTSPSNSTSDAGRIGAALLIQQNYVELRVAYSTFFRNTAMRQGGAIAVTAGERTVTLHSVQMYDNKAGLYGGALVLTTSSTVEASGCSFTNNTAVQGGAILATSMSTLQLNACNLTDNRATKFGGAISATTGGEVTLAACIFLRNRAGFAGAVECTSCNSLAVTSSSFLANTAGSSGGALVAYSAAGSVSLTGNVFRNNTAATNISSFTSKDCSRSSSGAGGAVCASITVAATLRNNTFDRNSATTGGALFVSRLCEVQADDTTCSTATANLMYDNILSNNTAVGGAGGAVYTPNVSALAVSCMENGTATSYSGTWLAKWPYGVDGCNGNWYGNAATEGGYGAGLATGLAMLLEAVGKGGSSRVNVSSNSEVVIVLQLYDFMGTAITKGTYEASGTTVAVWLDSSTNLTRYLGAGYSVNSNAGIANFSSLKLRAPPATYNLSFYALPIGVSDRSLYKWAKLSLEIRACKLGEVADSSGEQCNECSGPSYFGFNAANTSCDACPAYATCNFTSAGSNATSASIGGYLVPEDGYWHSSPFSPQMHECPTSGACTYTLRNKTLAAFQEANLTVYDTNLPTPNDSVLYDISIYWQLQCGPGYTGRLCGQCEAPDYGWRASGRCFKCPPLGLNTLYYVLSYMLTVALLTWTVRATLGRSLGESRALLRVVRSTAGRLRASGRHGSRGEGDAANGADDGDDEDDDDEEVFLAGGGSCNGSRRAVSSGGGGGGGAFFYATADADCSGSRRGVSGGAGGGFELSRRSGTLSGSSSSQRASFSKAGSGMLRSGGVSGVFDGGGGGSRRVSPGGGVLEMAAAAAMAQLEVEAGRKGAGGGYDDESDPYGSRYRKGYEYGYGNGGGFGGRLAGSGLAVAPVVEPSEGSMGPLLPAVLPGMKPNIRARVPRSVRARESRLANGSSGGGGGGGAAAAGGAITAAVGGDAAVLAARLSEGSDGSDGELAATRRHRLSRMSRAADAGGGGGEGGEGKGKGGEGGGAGGRSCGSGAIPYNGPIAEGMSPIGGRSGNAGRTSGAAGEGIARAAGPSVIAWSDGLRRRKPGEFDGGGGGEIPVSDAGSNSRRGGGGGGGNSGSWLDPVTSFRRQNLALGQQLKEDEAVREEKPPYAVVLKIMVNFLQVTSVARSLDLDFPDFIEEMWNVGSMASTAMTTFVSIDCSLPNNGISKAIQRTILHVAVPWIFILLSLPLWLLLYGMHVRRRRRAAPASGSVAASPTGRLRKELAAEKEEMGGMELELELGRAAISARGSGGGADSGLNQEEVLAAAAARAGPPTLMSYMVTRLLVTTIIIIFYFYPSVTDSLLSVYQCEQLDEQEGAYAGYLRTVGYFWELDYDLRCFRHSHVVLTLVVAVPGLVGWCVGVPAGSAVWLRRNAVRGRLNEQEFSDRYGFLYEDYRRSAYYWESVIMARKLLVVGLLLATNSSQDMMQVLVVMGVVVVAGCLQLYFQPYEQDRFNSLECFSLGSTLLVLYLCCFFLMDDLGEAAKQTISVAILVVYVGTLAWFVYCMAAEAWRYAVRVLDSDGDGRVTRGEVRAWLGLTLGAPLSRIVATVAAPRWWRRRRQRHDGGGGGGSVHGGVTAVGAVSGKRTAAAAPPPLVIFGQPSPPASPPPIGMASCSPPPSQPPPPHWQTSMAASPTAVPMTATQLKLPPASPQSPPSAAAAPPPQAATAPGVDPQCEASAPANESYTAVIEMRTSQELSPTKSTTSPPPACGGDGDGHNGPYGARRPGGSPPPPTAPGRERPTSDGLIDIDSGQLPGGTAPAAAMLAIPGSLPGSPLEAASRNGAAAGGSASRGMSSSSLGGPLAAAASASATEAAAADSRRGSRRGGPSGSGEGAGGGGGEGPRSTAALGQASGPGSPTGGATGASGRAPSR